MKKLFVITLLAVMMISAAIAACSAASSDADKLDFDISLYRTDLTSAPPFLEKDFSHYADLIDAIQVKVKTRGANGAGSRANTYLSICDIDMLLSNGDGRDFIDGDTEYFTLLFAHPGPKDKLLFSSYPYGYLKFCDIRVWNDATGNEPGLFADYIRIYFHLKNEGWFTTGIGHGWYRYASKIHFFEESKHWMSEYPYPYTRSTPAYMQYYGTWAEGNKWLALINGSCPHCDLKYTDLAGADFSKGDFTETDFTGAKLTGTVFPGAKIDGAIFEKADLSKTVLDNRDFTGAKLNGAKLHETSLKNSRFTGASLAVIDAYQADFENADFTAADLSNAAIKASNLKGALFERTVLYSPQRLKLGRMDLSNSDLSGANLANTDLSECIIAGVDFSGAKLPGAIIRKPLHFLNVKTDIETVCPNGKTGPCQW